MVLVLRDRDTTGDGTLDERLWVVQDANYNVTAIFDNSGNVVERYVYDPFGQVTVLDADWNERAAGSQFAWQYLHQGGRFDSVSGLYHFRHRDYSPTLGRWTSLDPIRYEACDVNLYRVVFNAPTIYTDPSGQIVWFFVIGGVAAGWYLLGPGAGTANAPAPGQEHFRPPPRPFAQDAIAGLPGALGGASVALAGEAVVAGAALLGRRLRVAPAPQGGNAAERLPQLQGMSRADAHIAIRSQGFQYHGTTRGGYVRYRHPDGSEVWIRPNGEVMRYGPPVQGRPGHPRLDRFGNRADHPQDEFLPPLPQQGR